MSGRVVAVACDGTHRFAKSVRPVIVLIAGRGVYGDAHCGATIQHRSRLGTTPRAANSRQVHLLQAELIDALVTAGYAVAPGGMGENVTTRGIDLLALPRGARLRLGSQAEVEVTGLRNPCRQIDTAFGPGAMAATLGRAPDRSVIRKAGVMAVVVHGGEVRPGDSITVTQLPAETIALAPV